MCWQNLVMKLLLCNPTTSSRKNPVSAKATMDAPALGAAICVGNTDVCTRCSGT